MTYNKKYSLGIYVNDWGFKIGSEGNTHIFLGLKIEKVKCNDMQMQTQESLYQHYLKHNMLKQAKQCKINIKQMQCFIDDKTLFDLQKELSEKYGYSITLSDEFKAWRDIDLDIIDSKVKALRETFNNDFAFLRQCYTDITEPFLDWLEYIKNKEFSQIDSFDEFENIFNEFIESKYSNLDSIEGFFGFGPYKTGLFRNYKENKLATGGKVFQNNHWSYEYKEQKEKYNKPKEQLKNKPLPRIPQNQDDKNFFMYSPNHYLTTIRPLKTFQEPYSEIIEINQDEYKKIAQQILFQTLITNDKVRKNTKIFNSKKNEFKNYKFVGNSCVDFVMDKLKEVGITAFDKAVTIKPYGVLNKIRHKKLFRKTTFEPSLSKGDKISYLLQDIHLFYQNYDNLCKLDSTWGSEKGLEAFTIYYTNLTTLDNYIFPLTFKKEHTNILGNIKTLEKNQAPFAFDKEILNVSLEYANYQQTCSINGDTPIAYDDFKLYIKQDDLARRVNTGIYIASELETIKTKMYDDKDNKISLLTFNHKKERFYIANAENDFSYQDFDLSYIDSKADKSKYSYVLKGDSLIIANNLKYYGNITQESMQTYIKVMVAKVSGNFENFNNEISLAKAYYTQQGEYNA